MMDHRAFYAEHAPGVEFVPFVRSDATPFRDREFDFVVSKDSAEHMVDPGKFCRELSRIAAAGAVCAPSPLADQAYSGPLKGSSWCFPLDHFHNWWLRINYTAAHISFMPRQMVFWRQTEPLWDESLLYKYFHDAVDTCVAL